MIKQALISVSDKSGIVDFAKSLSDLGVKILSTGGTAKLLADAGLSVTEVADYTGFPEMLDGRVKTLHPKVHGGILARRDLPEHMAALEKHDIPTIDLLVVNLYPFVQTVSKEECSLEDAIENIDIGGPTMLRSAAKNHRDVTVIATKGVALGTREGEHQLDQLNGSRLRSHGSFAEQDIPFIVSRPLQPEFHAKAASEPIHNYDIFHFALSGVQVR